MNARELLERLQSLTAEQLELPVVLAHDCWQWELTDAPQAAYWDGESVGTPATPDHLAGEVEHIGQEYVARFNKPCIAIGYINT